MANTLQPERIERIVRPVSRARVLETNVFHYHAPREKDLPIKFRKTAVFDFLLSTLKPSILLVHGRSATQHVVRLTLTELEYGQFTSVKYENIAFDVIAQRHLSYQWSFEKIDQFAKTLKARVGALRHDLTSRCS